MKKTFKIKSLRTNWEGFAECLEREYTKFLSLEYEKLAPKEKYEFFVEKITESIKKFTSARKIFKSQKKRNTAPWWDAECNKIKRMRRASYKMWNFSKELEDLIEYKKKVALAKKLKKKRK